MAISTSTNTFNMANLNINGFADYIEFTKRIKTINPTNNNHAVTKQYLPSYIGNPLSLCIVNGCEFSVSGLNIVVSAGYARSDDNTENIYLPSSITKYAYDPWVSGNGNPGLSSDVGIVSANTLYSVWIIKKVTPPENVDVLISDNFSSPTLPVDYTKKRLIAAYRTNASSAIITMKQSGSFFQYASEVPRDINDTSVTPGTWETGTMTVPPNCRGFFYVSVNLGGGAGSNTNRIMFQLRRNGDMTSASFEQSLFGLNAGYDLYVNATEFIYRNVPCFTDSLSRIQYVMLSANPLALTNSTIKIRTLGFDMITRNYV